MEPEPKNQETQMTVAGVPYRVLVEGIVLVSTVVVLVSTVGVAIIREGTASMHADGIDVRVLAIYRRWNLVTSVCSMFLNDKISDVRKVCIFGNLI